ncbi:MAG: hypothetical protein ABIT37_08855 [Luteolibacter sp.]
MSSNRWVALHCGDETEALLARHPKAFLVLCQIAMRAKWKDCPIEKMKAGEAFIGDYKEAGLKKEMEYRYAKGILADLGLATFRGTNKGTVAKLENTMIFSVSAEFNNGQSNGQETTKQRASNGQGTTNHTDTQIPGDTDTFFPVAAKLPTGKSQMAEDIYHAYPRKVAKADAIKAITKAMKNSDPVALLGKVQEYAAAIGWQEMRFIPHPATWFNQQRFNDDPKGWAQPTNGHHPTGVAPGKLQESASGIGRHSQRPRGPEETI